MKKGIRLEVSPVFQITSFCDVFLSAINFSGDCIFSRKGKLDF